MTDEKRVPFDTEQFFDRLIEKLEKAKANNFQPVIKEKPSWVIAVPDDIVDGRITDLFTIMVKQKDEELELHYGNTASGEFYMVTFLGVKKESFVRGVMEIIEHIYGGGTDVRL